MTADRTGPEPDYWTLAELRYHIRRFLRAREDAAREAGIEPQQYLLLLQIKGIDGRMTPTVGVLAERLQLRHHTTVELIDRLVERGFLRRRPGELDRREVQVELEPAGAAILRRLAVRSQRELKGEGPALLAALTELIGAAPPRPPARRPRGPVSARAARRGVAARRGTARG